MLRLNMRPLLTQTGRGIATVTIGATQNYVRRAVHRFDSIVTLQTAGAFSVCLRLGLIDPVAPWVSRRFAYCGRWNRRWRTKSLLGLLPADTDNSADQEKFESRHCFHSVSQG